MAVIINGDTGIDKITDGSVVQADLASGVAGNGPAFSATKSDTNQSVSNGTDTKITFNNEEFDTNNNFASSRFTPTVAGYYHLITTMHFDSANSNGAFELKLYKNGVDNGFFDIVADASPNFNCGGSLIVYANGTTDYFEVYARHGLGSTILVYSYSVKLCYFQGYLVRAA